MIGWWPLEGRIKSHGNSVEGSSWQRTRGQEVYDLQGVNDSCCGDG